MGGYVEVLMCVTKYLHGRAGSACQAACSASCLLLCVVSVYALLFNSVYVFNTPHASSMFTVYSNFSSPERQPRFPLRQAGPNLHAQATEGGRENFR